MGHQRHLEKPRPLPDLRPPTPIPLHPFPSYSHSRPVPATLNWQVLITKTTACKVVHSRHTRHKQLRRKFDFSQAAGACHFFAAQGIPHSSFQRWWLNYDLPRQCKQQPDPQTWNAPSRNSLKRYSQPVIQTSAEMPKSSFPIRKKKTKEKYTWGRRFQVFIKLFSKIPS